MIPKKPAPDLMAMATPIAHKGNLAGSKVMAMTMVDLLLRPELVAAAKTYFNDVQLKSQRPQSLLAETDRPQIQITGTPWRASARRCASSITTPPSTTPILISSASSFRS
jgi:hypothetical protein